jgi:predicted ATPase
MARYSSKPSSLTAPFLKSLTFIEERVKPREYPFNIPAFRGGKLELNFEQPVTIIVGENGTGKSTLLEGIASQCGFNLSGGSRNNAYDGDQNESPLGRALRLGWLPKVTRGFFLRAESFFNFGRHVDQLAKEDPLALGPYGGISLLAQSHGESFLSLASNRFGNGRGIYILDEPEAALSMQRQFQFLKIIRELELEGESQFIIATHSPIIMAYPGAQLLLFDGKVVREVSLSETPHYRIMRDFMNNPAIMMERLFNDTPKDDEDI